MSEQPLSPDADLDAWLASMMEWSAVTEQPDWGKVCEEGRVMWDAYTVEEG